MPLPRNTVRVALAAMLAVGALAACGSADSAPPSLNWQPCPERTEFDCATVTVPIDWSDHGAATIDIAVARQRAGDPSRKVGTLISLPGGPGSSGVDQILQGFPVSPELRARFDIISLDPRGVKRSHPVRCDSGLAQAAPNLIPDAGGQIGEIQSTAKALAASCREYTGPLIDHLDSASVARDVDALRSALGEDQINIYSRSYGTMPAQSYAELFPQHLRAMILDSVDDHSLNGRDFLASEARAGEDVFDQFAQWCTRDESCVLHGKDVSAIYTALFAEATRGELRTPEKPEKPLWPIDLSQRVTQPLYTPDWPHLAADLQTLAAQTPAPPTQPTTPKASGEPTLMPIATLCADWKFDIPNQETWQQLWHEQNTNAPTLRAHFGWGAATLCSGWPTAPANPPHRPRVENGPPILIMSSLHDPATPHEWATQVTTQTNRATLLTYEGWGHGNYSRTTCTTTAADNYLISLTLPPESHCPPA